MEPSFIGLAVFALLYLIGWRLGCGPLFGLMLSLPLGSTAFGRLPWLGGATPQIYTLFAIALLAVAFVRPRAAVELQSVFARQRCAWLVLVLMLLAGAGAILLPRLFAGETLAQLPVARDYVESPLRPSFRNLTQGGYFLLHALAYFAVSVLLFEKPRRALIVGAFFALCIAHTALGAIDLVAKHAGLGDVFAVLRTADYTYLSKDVVAGFPRLTGVLPEASAFAAMTLACLGFSFVYWRGTGSRLALGLALANVVLVLLSTSSTAYVGFPILCLPIAWRIAGSLRRWRPSPADGNVAWFGLFVVAIAVAVWWMNRGLFASYLGLIDAMVFEKLSSASGVERSHFNLLSIRNFLDTNALGVGLGSSRSSGWPIAVLSQLGLPGAVLMAALVFVLWRGMTGIRETPENAPLIAAGNSVCASALGGIVAISLSGFSADPGIVFFIALAVATSWRRHAQMVAAAQPEKAARSIVAMERAALSLTREA